MKNNVIQKDGKYYKKCKVVMLPAKDIDAKICIYKSNNELSTNLDKLEYHTNQHLYILSNEEIKEGDWILEPTTNEVFKCNKVEGTKILFYKEDGYEYVCIAKPKKVIATTDESLGLPRSSNEFIQKYVELQSNIDEVLVEVKIDNCLRCKGSREEIVAILGARPCLKCNGTGMLSEEYKLKVAPDNTITIRPVETKKDVFSREEVEKLCRKAFQAGGAKYEAIYKYRSSNIECPKEIEKFDAVPSENRWIKENL